MNILVSNDDGINVPGLWHLVEALHPLGEVTVVAPDREQSGVGAAISLGRAIRMHRIPFRPELVDTYSVEGTPGDAVILGLAHLLKDRPVDLVVSGVNRGANSCAEVLLSGTVGAAWHGLIRGVPAIAVSAAYRPDNPMEPNYQAGALVAAEIARLVGSGQLPRNVLYNLNVPLCPTSELRGLYHALPSYGSHADTVREEDDGRGRAHYYLVYRRVGARNHRGTEDWALFRRMVSLTLLDTQLRPRPRHLLPQAECDAIFDRVMAARWPMYAARQPAHEPTA